MKTVDQASCSRRVPQDSRSIRELSDSFFFFFPCMFCLLILSVSLNHADLLIVSFLLQFFLFGSCVSFSLFLTSVDKKKKKK